MIALLRGRLVERQPGRAVIDVAGFGFEVAVSLPTYRALGEPGERVELHVHTHVREGALGLFGFHEKRERELFLLLLGVAGIGPRLALAALSTLGTDGLMAVARRRDASGLASVPGIGRKTAERILLEVGERIASLAPLAHADPAAADAPAAAGIRQDVVSALVNLGYNARVAGDAAERTLGSLTDEAPTFETLLKRTLRTLAR